MVDFFTILSVFITCSFAFKIGFPTALVLFKYNYIKTILVACGGGFAGNVFFTYLSAAILKAIHNFRVKRNLIHRKKIFTKFNRRIIRVKKRFGLAGIAFLTPPLLSTPLGAFLAERFFKNKRKIILYLSVATVFWAFTFSLIMFIFHAAMHGWKI